MQKSYKIAIVIFLGLFGEAFAHGEKNGCRFICSVESRAIKPSFDALLWIQYTYGRVTRETCELDLPEVDFSLHNQMTSVRCPNDEILRRKLTSGGENATESIYCCSQ